jgi:hypothetical protein
VGLDRKHTPPMRVFMLLLLAAVIAGLAAGSGSARSEAAPPTLIRLLSITTSQQNFDKPPKGPSKGDRMYGVSKLVNTVAQFGQRAGAEVGSDVGWYTFKTKKTEYADGTTRLPGGTLHFRGKISTSQGAVTVPVLGGTGIFEGAVGTLYIGAATSAGVAENVYRLTYDLIA